MAKQTGNFQHGCQMVSLLNGPQTWTLTLLTIITDQCSSLLFGFLLNVYTYFVAFIQNA